MRISKRICSVILAGTLACGLGFGSLALADSVEPGAEGSTNVAEALSSLQSTQISYETFSAYGVQLMLPKGLSMVADVTEEDGDVMLEYEDETCGISVEIAELGLDEETANLLIESLVSSFTEAFSDARTAITGYLVDDSRLVDVTLFVTDASAESTEGSSAFIELTFLFTKDATATVMSYVAADDDETMYVLERIHGSLAPSAAGAPATTEPGTGTAEPGTVTPAAPSAGTVASDGAATFEMPGWDVVIKADSDSMLFDTIAEDYWDSDVAGKSVIAVPISVTNTGTESANAWWDLTFAFYGPSGVAQQSSFGWVYDDDYSNLPDMRSGATADAYLYFEDEGDGIYAIEVSAFDEDYNKIKYEVEFEVTRTA